MVAAAAATAARRGKGASRRSERMKLRRFAFACAFVFICRAASCAPRSIGRARARALWPCKRRRRSRARARASRLFVFSWPRHTQVSERARVCTRARPRFSSSACCCCCCSSRVGGLNKSIRLLLQSLDQRDAPINSLISQYTRSRYSSGGARARETFVRRRHTPMTQSFFFPSASARLAFFLQFCARARVSR